MEVRYVVIAILSVISCVVYLGLIFSDEQKVYESTTAWGIKIFRFLLYVSFY